MASVRSLRDEPTINELIEARERTDAGHRLAFPRLFEGRAPATPGSEFDGLGADPEQEIDDALIGRIADRVSEWRHEAFHDLRHLDKNAPRNVHIAALAVVATFDDFLDEVREHLRGAE